MFEVECIKCHQQVRVGERMKHLCNLSKLYSRAVEKVIMLSVGQKACIKKCKKLLSGHAFAPTSLEKRYILHDKLCDDCSKSEMVQLFEQFKTVLPHLYRTSRGRRRVISPFHAYKLNIISSKMKSQDLDQFENSYRLKLQYLREKEVENNVPGLKAANHASRKLTFDDVSSSSSDHDLCD